MRIRPLIILFATVLCILTGCISDCYVSQRALMGVVFINANNVNSERSLSSLTVQGVGSDSLLYNGATTSRIYLPLKANDSNTSFACSYVVQVDETTSNTYSFTINVNHTPMPQLISEECGCVMFQTLNNVSIEGDATAEWRVEIYNPEVTNVEEDVHVQVFIP